MDSGYLPGTSNQRAQNSKCTIQPEKAFTWQASQSDQMSGVHPTDLISSGDNATGSTEQRDERAFFLWQYIISFIAFSIAYTVFLSG